MSAVTLNIGPVMIELQDIQHNRKIVSAMLLLYSSIKQLYKQEMNTVQMTFQRQYG